MAAFAFFGSLYVSVTFIDQKKEKEGKQALKLLVAAWSTPWQKIASQYVMLSGAWPFYRSGNTSAVPARITLEY